MNAPLSLYLARFTAQDGSDGSDGSDGAAAPHGARCEPDRVGRPGAPSPVEPLITLSAAELDARLAAARRSATEDATAAQAAAHAAALEAALAAAARTHAADAAAALAAARGAWAADEGKAAAAGLGALAGLRDLLADKVADVLRPLLAQALAERARLAVGVALDQILDDPDEPCLTVSGPADLLEAIRAARPASGRDGQRVAYLVASAPDVTVSARATRIETRLGAALAALAAPPALVDTEARP